MNPLVFVANKRFRVLARHTESLFPPSRPALLCAMLCAHVFNSVSAQTTASSAVPPVPAPVAANANPLSLAIAKAPYQLTINGVPYGMSEAETRNGQLFIERILANQANLRCYPPDSTDDKFCTVTVNTLRLSEDGKQLDLSVAPEGLKDTVIAGPAPLAAIPELPLGQLGYLRYNANAARLQDGRNNLSLASNGSLRLNEHAFDVASVGLWSSRAATQTLVAGSTQSQGFGFNGERSSLLFTTAAYRRDWFEERLQFVAGRTSTSQRGFLGGATLDGVRLARLNFDNQGNTLLVGSRPVSGYLAAPGILSYRVGGIVYKEIPLPAGPYSVASSEFLGYPANGTLETVSVDGARTTLDLPLAASRPILLFRQGEYDWDLQAGRVRRSDGSYDAAVSAGTRYGLTNDISAEMAVLIRPRNTLLTGQLDARLPAALGEVSGAAAVQKSSMDTAASNRKSLRALYGNKWGAATYGVDFLRHYDGGVQEITTASAENSAYNYSGFFNGGTNYGFLTAQPQLARSAITRDVRAYVFAPLGETGVNANLRLIATSYIDSPKQARFAELQLGGGLGRLGSWSTYLRTGRNQSGLNEWSFSALWSVPFGSGQQAGISYQTNRVEGKRSGDDDIRVFVGGTIDGTWNAESSYAASTDRRGNLAMSYNRKFEAVDTSISLFRSSGQSMAGYVTASGGVVVADDGHVIAARNLTDSITLLQAKELAGAEIFQQGSPRPVSRMDSAGYGVVSNMRAYKTNRIRISDDDVPIGLEVPDNVMDGFTVHPYRAYVLKVPMRVLRPGRLFINLPSTVINAYALVGELLTPVEPDGSVYVEDLSLLAGKPLAVVWNSAGRDMRCNVPQASIVIDTTPVFERKETVQVITNLQCQPQETP